MPSPDGRIAEDGLLAHFLPAPFRFCLRCGVAYGGRARSDFPKLATVNYPDRTMVVSTTQRFFKLKRDALAAMARVRP